jgi:hypothetical protein
MKPMLFKDQVELVNFIQSLPTPDGVAMVQGEELDSLEILSRLARLVPDMFEYKKVLGKGANGLGSQKSVLRYAEVMGTSNGEEKYAAYNVALEAIEVEANMLIEQGAGSELAASLRQVRTKVAAFALIKQSIEGFRDKMNKYMARVEETYAELSSELTKQKKALKGPLAAEQVEILVKEIQEKYQAVSALIESMNEYCALQVSYNGLCLGR